MSKREDFMMNPRFIARIITDEINPDLIQFKRNKLGIFFRCLYKNNHFRKCYLNTERQRPFLHTFTGIKNRNQNFKIPLEK